MSAYFDTSVLVAAVSDQLAQHSAALHVIAAKKAGCDLVYTYNHRHFASLAAGSVVVSTP